MSITIFNTNPGGGGGTVTADNGLNIPSPGGPVELGGPLIKDTNVDRAGFELFINDTSDPNIESVLSLEPTEVTINVTNNTTENETSFVSQAGAGSFIMDNGLTLEAAGLHLQALGGNHVRTSLEWLDENTGNGKRLAIDNTSFLIEDQVSNQGVQYAADYSANFVARSLIDAAFFFANLNPKVVAAGRFPGITVSGQILNFLTQANEATYRGNVAVTYVSGTGTITVQFAWHDEAGTPRTFSYAALSVAGVSNNPPFVLNAHAGSNVIISYVIVGVVTANVYGYLEIFQ